MKGEKKTNRCEEYKVLTKKQAGTRGWCLVCKNKCK